MNKCPISSEWRTPDDLFNILDKGGVYQGIEFKGFNFELDLCATKENSKCNSFCADYLNNKARTFEHDRDDLYSHGLDFYDYKNAFMNPPYSNPKPFIEKAWEDSRHCRIVCLVKCDPSTQWWATFWDYGKCSNCGDYHGHKPGAKVIYFPKRIKFDPPQQLIDSGEVWDLNEEILINCKECYGGDEQLIYPGKYCSKCNSQGFYRKNKSNKWAQKCKNCKGEGKNHNLFYHPDDIDYCYKCEGKGYKPLSGPAFGCALLVFDRRDL